MPARAKWVIPVACLVAAVWSFLLYANTRREGSGEIIVPAHVVGMEARLIRTSHNSVKKTYHPTIRFENRNREPYKVTLQHGADVKLYEMNEAVTVIYREGKEQEARIRSVWEAALPNGLLLAGVTGTIAALILTVIFSRKPVQSS